MALLRSRPADTHAGCLYQTSDTHCPDRQPASRKLFPNACMAPAVKAAIYRLPLTIPLRQVAPRAATLDPQAAIHELPGIRCAVIRITESAGQEGRNRPPLRRAQLVTLYTHPGLHASGRICFRQRLIRYHAGSDCPYPVLRQQACMANGMLPYIPGRVC